MKFRKKPVEVEANQWWRNGDHPYDYTEDRRDLDHDQEGEVVGYYHDSDPTSSEQPRRCKYCNEIMQRHGWIKTSVLWGHIVCPGDWIIADTGGKYYACKPNIFNDTYAIIA